MYSESDEHPLIEAVHVYDAETDSNPQKQVAPPVIAIAPGPPEDVNETACEENEVDRQSKTSSLRGHETIDIMNVRRPATRRGAIAMGEKICYIPELC